MRGAKQTALTVALLLASSSSVWAQGHIQWVNSWQEASTQAQRHQRLVLIHFWSDNCPPCVKLERGVFNRPEVIRAVMSNYVALKVHVTQNPDLVRYFNVKQWPTDVFVDAQGVELHRAPSAQDSNRYIATLDQVAAHARINAPFSGAASTEIAAASRDSDTGYRTSAFPVGATPAATTPTGQAPARPSAYGGPMTPGMTPGMAPGMAPNRPLQPAGSLGQPGPANPQASQQAAPARPAYVNNQFAGGGQFQPPTTTPTFPIQQTRQPQPTTNQFAQGGAAPQGTQGSGLAPRDSQQQPIPQQRASVAPVGHTTPGPDTIGMEGYCCVTLVEQEKWVKGDPQWGVLHRGRAYLFTGPQEQQKFLASFDKYAPALSGFDSVKYAEQGVLVEGRRAHGVFYRRRIFLFADEAALQQFWSSPDRYLPLVQAEQDRQAARQ